MPDGQIDDPPDPLLQNPAYRAGQTFAARLRARRRPAADEAEREPAGLSDDDQQEAARLTEQDQRESRRGSYPMSFALRADLKDRLNKFRGEGGNFNVSGLCNDAIERELDRLTSGNAVVQRLRVELTERRGLAWTMGYQSGRKWAEEVATWLEITEYATRYTNRDVKVRIHNEDSQFMYSEFSGRFHAPERDYGRDVPDQPAAAPSFNYIVESGETNWEYRTNEIEAYWRAWLAAVHEVYDAIKEHLPSVVDQLSPEEIPDPERPRDVDPDDIPF